jgi:3',5'-cyclic AMP phosphodiesterase CpdA
MYEESVAHKRQKLNRRDFLRLGGVVGAASVAAACGPLAVPGSQPTTDPAKGRDIALRIAHITDMHIEPFGPGTDGLARALRHVHSLSPAADFVLNTGDCVMDSLEVDKSRSEKQWDAFQNVMQAECKLPVFHAIGNHDVWGWGLPAGLQAEISGDPLYGKGMAVTRLGLPDRYYSFDQGGWRFIVLDSNHRPEGDVQYPYSGKLDEEQFQWLAAQLESTPDTMPVCIASHIPILAACEFLDGDNETTGNWVVPGAWMHIDARRLWKLFWEHPNVKLCLSGHTHQVEDLRYHGVKYLTNGAISANWWNGPYFDFPPGYVIVTLYTDGSSESEFVAY